MPYSPTTWVDGTTAANQVHMNNLESQYAEASQSLEQDLFNAFVYSGYVATKDGTTATKLDVTSGVAFLLQADGTLRRRAIASSNQTTVTPSATYHLYLQPDGSWYWSTSNTPAANSLFIAQVTTDGSGNISTVTDERTLNTTFMPSMAGSITIPNNLTVSGGVITGHGASITVGNGTNDILLTPGSGHWTYLNTSGTNNPHVDQSGNIITGGQVQATGGVTDNGSRVAVQGAHSAGQPFVSYGTGVPGTLSVNEVYFQIA